MSISYRILGQPGRDNALFVEINTGQAIHRLQFDCGEACLRDLPVSQIQAIDSVLFSHFASTTSPVSIASCAGTMTVRIAPCCVWGPAGATDIIHHRLQGVTWKG